MSAPNSDLDRLQAAVDALGVRTARGDQVPLEPVRWLWPSFLPAGMITILGGAPGCGKTTITLSLAATVTRGGFWPDGTRCAEPGDVMVWSGEDPNSLTAARLVASGADMTRIHFVEGLAGSDDAFDPARDMLLLEATATRLPNLQMLILDPIVAAVTGDSHKNAEVRRSLQPVVDLCKRLGCAVLGITHFSKGTSGSDPMERVTGSIAFVALARLLLVAAKVRAAPGEDGEDAEPRRVMMRAKSNISPDGGGFAYELERVEVAPEVEGQRVRWLQAIHGSARDTLAEADAEGDEASGVDGFLRGLLADGPMSAKAIKADADGAGYAWRTVQRAAQRLGVDRRKESMKGGWVWALGSAPKAPRRCQGAEGAEDATDTRAASSDDRLHEGVSPHGMAPSESSAPSVPSVAPSSVPATSGSGRDAGDAPLVNDVEVL